MRRQLLVAALSLIVVSAPALAQKKPQAAPPAPAPAKPYKPVAIAPPAPAKDAALDTFRGKVGDAAQKKDRAALGPLVVNAGFFWDRESGKGADAKKSGADVLATALGLKNKDAPGWDILASYAEEPSVSATPRHPGAMCACLLYTSPSPRDRTRSRMPSSA